MTFFSTADIQHAFDQAAASYDKTAALPQEIRHRMMDRLFLMRIQPKTILALGVGAGDEVGQLQKYYPNSVIFSIDLSEKMLQTSATRNSSLRVCANAEALPLTENSIDLIFSNLMLPWCNDIEQVFKEAKRILKPNGLFLFSTFGPDTLKELRFSWARVEENSHVHLFFDLHDIGDALLRAGFSDPVMDMELLTLTYEQAKKSLQDLKRCGMHNILQDRRKTLTGKYSFQTFLDNYETFRQKDGLLPNTYEIAYGHAWKISRTKKTSSNEISIPVSAVKRIPHP